MAELEMINHMKKSLKALSNHELSVKEKIKEFFVEIFIIVFAVSLSIWLHGVMEHRHQQAEVKFFLTELYKDLDYDLLVYAKAKQDCEETARGYAYLSNLPYGIMASKDSINHYKPFLFRKYTPLPTQGRYESFKNSGKINNIHDADLEGDILDLFEEDVKSLNIETNGYRRLQETYTDYLALHLKRSGKENNMVSIYSSDESINFSQQLSDTRQLDTAYTKCISKINLINKQIVEEIGPIK